MRFPSVAAIAAAMPLLIGAVEPLRIKPSSQWVLDYGEESCRLIRTFGEEGDKTIFTLESEAPGRVDMLVIGKRLNTYRENAFARFLPVQQKPIEGRVAKSTTTGEPALLWANVDIVSDDVAETKKKEEDKLKSTPRARPSATSLADKAMMNAQRSESEARATELEIVARPGRPVILETGSMGQAMKMFEQCSRDSLRDWGVDSELEDRIVRRAWATNPSDWLSSNDYPRNMVFRGEESEVKIRLLVDAAGRVTKCTSLSHFSAPEFKEVVCDGIRKRARFEPAELTDGTKVPSYYVGRVVFRIAQ